MLLLSKIGIKKNSGQYKEHISVLMWSWHSERERFISEDRKAALISDVDYLVPAKFKKLFSLIDKIIETNKETLSSVFERIKGSSEPAFLFFLLTQNHFFHFFAWL